MSLFPEEPERPAQASRLMGPLRDCANERVYYGTSSWKYEGWLGSIYTPERYLTRGKFSRKKFEETCLTEYAETFPIVSGDFAFYQFPSSNYWQTLFEQVPDSFQFAFKVPQDLTVLRWPNLRRHGSKAGKPNEGFLRADLFGTLFAKRLQPYQSQVAVLIFEFGTFAKGEFSTANDFLDQLGPFLGKLPAGFRYAIEIRNQEFLGEAYFSTLADHNVAHVFNAWTRMPTLTDQLDLDGSTTADFNVCRALLTKGRKYEQAVQQFEPYDRIQEPNQEVRAGLSLIAQWSRQQRKPAFLFINNRLEGNAPGTIESII